MSPTANDKRLASIRTDNKNQYYHGNHLGSASVITDQTGTQKQKIEYYPYGSYRYGTSPDQQMGTYDYDTTFPNANYTFTDQEDDDETGLYNYGARLYDPQIGRFISADSIVPEPGDLQAFNRYSYCINNPLVYEDPSGHFWWGVMNDYSYGYNDDSLGAYHGMYYNGNRFNFSFNNTESMLYQNLYNTQSTQNTPMIQNYNPGRNDITLDPYKKTTPGWFQDVGTMNNIAKVGCIAAMFTEVGIPVGLKCLAVTSYVDVASTGTEAFVYKTKPEKRFWMQAVSAAITQGASSVVVKGLTAKYLGADADLIGGLMHNGNRFYSTYTATGMSRYVPNAYGLKVVLTEGSTNTIDAFVNNLYQYKNEKKK